ncbi:outer membrane protein assembly factor BamE [Thiomicrorhabdus sp. 6S3-12]|nr:outer membrane protein assembly factor BamE [Thiomicrorhabdus sp. 6S3-12]
MLSQAQVPANKPSRIKKLILTGLLFSTIGALNGCSAFKPYEVPVTQGNVMTEESLDLIQEGLNQIQVRKLLGPPIGQNTFNPYHWEYLFYTTDPKSDLAVKRHLVLQFDENFYLTKWESHPIQVQMKKDDSFLGLGWF